MTVIASTDGEIRAADLGVCLMHEHVFINEMREDRSTGLLNDFELMRRELAYFREAGGKTILELSVGALSLGAAPDPAGRLGLSPTVGTASEGTRASSQVDGLAQLSQQTGVQFVLGTGLYRDPYIDREWVDRVGVNGVAEAITRDATSGFGDTGIRAGIIGEVGSDSFYVSATEERCLRGAARAQCGTGLSVTTHAARWPVGLDQLDILVSEGVDPRRVIIGHCDTVKIPEYHEEIARRGSFVQFDTIRDAGEYEINSRVEMIANLVAQGFSDRILLSHDVCMRPHLKTFGGSGYAFILETFLARLANLGFGGDLRHELLVENPRRALTGGE